MAEAREVINTSIWLPVFGEKEALVGWCDITRGVYVAVGDLTPEGLGGRIFRDTKIRGELSAVLAGKGILRTLTKVVASTKKPRINRKSKRRYPNIPIGQVRNIRGRKGPTNYGITSIIAETLREKQPLTDDGLTTGMTVKEVADEVIHRGFKNETIGRSFAFTVGVALATAARRNSGGYGIYRTARARYGIRVPRS